MYSANSHIETYSRRIIAITTLQSHPQPAIDLDFETMLEQNEIPLLTIALFHKNNFRFADAMTMPLGTGKIPNQGHRR